MRHRLSRRITGAVIGVLLAGLLAGKAGQAQEVTVIGDYQLHFRWLHEPAIVQQPNAVVVTVSKIQPGAALPTPAVTASFGVNFLLPLTNTVLTEDDVKVQVQLTGIDPNRAGNYQWSLYLDGQLQLISGVGQTGYILPDVAPGAHVLTATVVGGEPVGLGAVGMTTFQVELPIPAATSNTQAATPTTAENNAEERGLELTVLIEYAGVTQVLYLEPSPESNQYSARLTPTQAGAYGLRLQGKVQGEPLDLAVELPPVQADNLLDYLRTSLVVPTLANGATLLLAAFGVFTLGLGILLLRRD